MTPFKITEAVTGPQKNITVLRVDGSVDAGSSDLLAAKIDEIRAGQNNRIIMDCSRMKFISSSGMRVFLAVEDDIKARGGGLKFAAVPDPVLNVFKKVGISEVFRICRTELEAVEEFSAGR